MRGPADGIAIPHDFAPPQRGRIGGTRLLLVGLLLGLAVAALELWWLQRSESTVVATGVEAPPVPAWRPTTPFASTEGDGLADRVDAPVPPEAPAEATPAAVTRPATGARDASVPLEDVIARVLPSVVSIHAGSGRGTGFFVRPDIVLTNAHVVGTNTSVRLQSGSTDYQARVVRLSPGADLAVLQVDSANPQQAFLTLGSARAVRAGQEVIAIGFALGVLSNTVTRGIVSAVRNTGSVVLIQTDAAINPGNSGGPLVDRAGVVVGVSSMRVAGSQGGEGLAFAVAIDHGTQLLNGDAGAATVATPLQGLNRIMSGSSESSDMRERGERDYQRTLEQAARHADQLDAYWDRYAKGCVVTATGGGDRSWFAVFEAGGVQISATSGYNCRSWLNEVRTHAEAIRDALVEAAEAARRQGVYPGIMRDLRRQHRMAWTGWER
jgi:S1-C subfamily serine protease